MTKEELDQLKEQQLQEDLKLGFFMKVLTSWGLSTYPGKKVLTIFPDATYTLTQSFFKETPPNIDTTPKYGILLGDLLEKLRTVANSMTENKYQLIMDSTFAVSIISNGIRIKHENVEETFQKVVEILGDIWKSV